MLQSTVLLFMHLIVFFFLLLLSLLSFKFFMRRYIYIEQSEGERQDVGEEKHVLHSESSLCVCGYISIYIYIQPREQLRLRVPPFYARSSSMCYTICLLRYLFRVSGPLFAVIVRFVAFFFFFF